MDSLFKATPGDWGDRVLHCPGTLVKWLSKSFKLPGNLPVSTSHLTVMLLCVCVCVCVRARAPCSCGVQRQLKVTSSVLSPHVFQSHLVPVVRLGSKHFSLLSHPSPTPCLLSSSCVSLYLIPTPHRPTRQCFSTSLMCRP